MENKQQLLRSLPKVDDLLHHSKIRELEDSVPRTVLLEVIRGEIDNLRRLILEDKISKLEMTEESIIELIKVQALAKTELSLKPLINATGVVLHTNLGRAVLAPAACDAIHQLAASYSNLEYDLTTGSRGKRYDHVEELLCKITGAESAVVVNNNAAAVLLILSTMAKGGEVIVSRGELVEIGGSFRIPDVMAESGAMLKEVGTTNKTHLSDYKNNITEHTAALLKVHTSNYRILGFTEDVSLAEMVNIGKEETIPVIYDMGSGLLYDLAAHGIGDEQTVQMAVASGADIVSFSGDKLLGGTQAGIILGKKAWISKMKKHPLMRALRIDKLTLVALEATLKIYLDQERAAKEIPVLAMILASKLDLVKKAKKLSTLLEQIAGLDINLESGYGQVGGGSMPTVELVSVLIGIKPEKMSVQHLAIALRKQKKAIITRIQNNSLYLDVRTIEEADFDYIASSFKHIIENEEE